MCRKESVHINGNGELVKLENSKYVWPGIGGPSIETMFGKGQLIYQAYFSHLNIMKTKGIYVLSVFPSEHRKRAPTL